MDKLLVSPMEAAELLSIKRTLMYTLLRTGAIPSISLGRCRRIAVTDLQRMIEERKEKVQGRNSEQS